VRSAGSSVLAGVGFFILLAFSAAGIHDLFIPPPPSLPIKATEAAYLCFEGIILMTLTNCVAFFLGMLATGDINQGIRAWDAIFKVLSDGATLLKGGKPQSNS
jgi:hypothetical protein